MISPTTGRKFPWQRLLPLLVMIAGLAAFFAFDLDQYLSFSTLAEHRVTLLKWVSENSLLAPLIYMLIYVVVVAFSLPGGAVMTISGGFLFSALAGGIYAVIGATLGAVALFLIAKTSLGDFLLAKAGATIKKMQAGFEENALSYMFVLRLIPVFPFFLVNLAPAFLGVPLRTYIIATFFGIMPATFVFALVGAGLGSVFDSGQSFSLQGILTPEIMAALGGLALLSLIPVVFRKVQSTRAAKGEKGE